MRKTQRPWNIWHEGAEELENEAEAEAAPRTEEEDMNQDTVSDQDPHEEKETTATDTETEATGTATAIQPLNKTKDVIAAHETEDTNKEEEGTETNDPTRTRTSMRAFCKASLLIRRKCHISQE